MSEGHEWQLIKPITHFLVVQCTTKVILSTIIGERSGLYGIGFERRQDLPFNDEFTAVPDANPLH